MVYTNREEASEILIDKLRDKNLDVDVVAALPRGGVCLGEKIADYYNVPLEIITVGSLRIESCPKFELGAVADDGTLWIEDHAIEGLNVSTELIEKSRIKSFNRAQEELTNYIGERTRNFKGKNVLLVDEGACKSMCLMAAIGLLKKQNARSITVLLPVASRDVVMDINSIADKSLVVKQPRFLSSKEAYFESLNHVSKNKVKEMVGRRS